MIGIPGVERHQRGRGGRQVDATVADLDAALPEHLEQFVDIVHPGNFLHLLRMQVAHLDDVGALVIGVEQFRAVGTAGAGKCTPMIFEHGIAVAVPRFLLGHFLLGGVGHVRKVHAGEAGGGDAQQRFFLLAEGDGLAVGFVGVRTVFDFHAESEPSGSAGENRVQKGRSPGFLHQFFRMVVHNCLLIVRCRLFLVLPQTCQFARQLTKFPSPA